MRLPKIVAIVVVLSACTQTGTQDAVRNSLRARCLSEYGFALGTTENGLCVRAMLASMDYDWDADNLAKGNEATGKALLELGMALNEAAARNRPTYVQIVGPFPYTPPTYFYPTY